VGVATYTIAKNYTTYMPINYAPWASIVELDWSNLKETGNESKNESGVARSVERDERKS
jgi:hypothetical protein